MTKSLLSRIDQAPIPHDIQRGREAATLVPEAKDLITGAAGSSPYLADLIAREADWLTEALSEPPEKTLDAILADVDAAAGASRAEIASRLRIAKRRTALLTALADLGGVWPLEDVTSALSRLADGAVHSALRHLVAEQITRGRIPGATEADIANCAGLASIAMGKGGAYELNYSSDIDLIFLFDETRFDPDDYATIRARFIKICQAAAKLIGETTGEGYVFRVDLRLRPDPSVTPVCIAMEAAERYYESQGRTWERAAFIKARAASGDVAAGERFLAELQPFVWRRHLDFAAIGDAQDIRDRIRAHRGGGGPIAVPGHDVKLGRGGIRTIEFFAQTRQLICGGRDPALRRRGTRPALAALTDAGWVEPEIAAALYAAYVAHRTLEHRLQMIEDARTHLVPTAVEARDRVAALSGWSDRAAFEADILARLEEVDRLTEPFFTPAGPRKAETERPAFDSLGFERPDAAEKIAERWRSGAINATRSSRARRILTGLEPQIFKSLAAAASPDEALSEFDRFLSGLPAGIQILSLFESNPALLDLIVEICAAAPRLAGYLGRNSRVLDALLDQHFFEPLPDVEALTQGLADHLAEDDDYERKLDAARRWSKEYAFRVGVQMLRGLADAAEAGRGFSAVAEASLRGLMPVVVAEFARRYGPPPGRGAVVVAMGKLGSREMTATSDLDLIVIYDAAGAEASDGPRPLPVKVYFARFTQMLISAMTAPTAEGSLYEIDMRLRPSGRQGTVATSLASFRHYQAESAWTWEHMALTRARSIAGDPGLAAEVDASIAKVVERPRDASKTLAEIAAMRAKIADARRRDSVWDLKNAMGGLMDIDFAAQAGALVNGLSGDDPPGAMLARLEASGWLSAADHVALAETHALLSTVQQVARIALDGELTPDRAGEGLRQALTRAAGVADFDALEAMLAAAEAEADAAVTRLLGEPPAPVA